MFSSFNHILSENPGCPDPSSHDLFGCCLIQPDFSSTQQRSNPATQRLWINEIPPVNEDTVILLYYGLVAWYAETSTLQLYVNLQKGIRRYKRSSLRAILDSR